MTTVERLFNKVIDAIPNPLPETPQKTVIRSRPQSFTADDMARSPNFLGMYLGQHHSIAGSTGSGKTYYALNGVLPYLHNLYPHVKRYVLDSTSDPDMLSLIPHALQHTGNSPPPLLHSPAYVQVWSPDNSKIPQNYAAWFDKLNDSHEPLIVMIDETASITREAVLSLETLLKQTRKHRGTVICLTQQIAKIDTAIFSQCTHVAIFNIGSEIYDTSRARSLLRLSKQDYHVPRHAHGFWYRNTRSDTLAYEHADMHAMFKKEKR